MFICKVISALVTFTFGPLEWFSDWVYKSETKYIIHEKLYQSWQI